MPGQCGGLEVTVMNNRVHCGEGVLEGPFQQAPFISLAMVGQETGKWLTLSPPPSLVKPVPRGSRRQTRTAWPTEMA